MADRMPTMTERLRNLHHVVLDLDGTIYNGGTLFATTRPFLALLDRLDIGYTFITNNPSKSVADYLQHLQRMGITAQPEQLYTSTQATIAYLRQLQPRPRRLFVLGTESMSQEVEAAGFGLCADSANDEPDAVVVGFDKTLTYSRLCRAAWWIKNGKPYIATNPDRVCPTDEPTVLVDCGSICAALQTATGCAPTAVMGKPDPAMLRGLLLRHELRPDELAMVGDRLYTDMVMSRRAGVLGVLVLTGETTAAMAAKHTPPPDLVVSDLAGLGEMLRAARAATPQ
jgi:HAD superfamily hydrolase (TIGR01450 family)